MVEFLTGARPTEPKQIDLMTGLATTRFAREGVNFTRELVASKPDEVIIMRLKADKPGVGVVGGTKFLALLGAKTVDGNISATDDGLKITGANEATLIVPAGTDMFDKNFSTIVRQRIDAALEKPFDKVRDAATTDTRRYVARCQLTLVHTLSPWPATFAVVPAHIPAPVPSLIPLSQW